MSETFHLFPSLPTELGLKIWASALEDPSIYMIWFYSFHLLELEAWRSLPTSLIQRTRGRDPDLEAILSACRKSPAIALKTAPDLYEMITADESMPLNDPARYMPGGMRYNAASHLIFFQNDMFNVDDYLGFADMQTALPNPIRGAEHLVIELSAFQPWGGETILCPENHAPCEGVCRNEPLLRLHSGEFQRLKRVFIRVWYDDGYIANSAVCRCEDKFHEWKVYTLRTIKMEEERVKRWVEYDPRTGCLEYPPIEYRKMPRGFPWHVGGDVEIRLLFPVR